VTHAEPTINDLGVVISSPRIRQYVYAVYVLALLAIGGIIVGFASVSVALPTWATAANAIIAYLGIPVGGLAAANVRR
jgi:hypothetical protein